MKWEDIKEVIEFGGVILGIVVVVWQAGPAVVRLAKRWLAVGTEIPTKQAGQKDDLVFRHRQLTGLGLAMVATILWSVSYASYRTEAALRTNSVVLAAAICVFGAFTLLLIGALARRRDRSKLPVGVILSPLRTWTGVGMVAGTAAEFVLFIMATHYISAGQTMALWKTNPVWVLILFAILTHGPVRKVSIAAVSFVLLGVYIILEPNFSGPIVKGEMIGSVLAIIGGFAFALYTICVYRYPLTYTTSKPSERLFVQAAVLGTTGALLVAVCVAMRWTAVFDSSLWSLVLFNGIRIGIVYACYTEAIKLTHEPVLITSIVALEVPATIMFEYCWFGHAVTSNVLLGATAITIGILSIIQENEMLNKKLRPERRRAKEQLPPPLPDK